METKFKSWTSAMNNVQRQKKTFDENPIKIHPSVFLKMEEMAIKQKWKDVVGPLFAKAATTISLGNNILYITIKSPAIRNELQMQKTTIITRMNEELGKTAVRDIILR